LEKITIMKMRWKWNRNLKIENENQWIWNMVEGRKMNFEKQIDQETNFNEWNWLKLERERK
jgi:hypothetical protein